MMVVPLGTLTGVPSMVRLTRSLIGSRHRRRATPGEIGLEFPAELLDAADHRGGAGVGEDTDGLAGHVLGEVEQEIQVLRLPLTREDALQDLDGPGGPFTALRALRARLV